ncbi:hypothetical protein FE257_012627 [Aspergillus nanangensis]|uniref:Uncharacterized protein n=1 Tax=Aspergillus nanangensis TaxID=2582783 RepID=A0AAD4CG92_ASPNN|nr:hypothetical protein FE257_012627 [Aspergillus nanangensis]
MPEPAKRIILEKSRTVRRQYQRNRKLLKFTPSQIARIEREQERERRAQTLREKEKKRIANKKKKEEKEAKEREERRRQGLPDPNAPTVPSSQPLLFNFLSKGPPLAANSKSPAEEKEVTSPTTLDSVSTDIDGSDVFEEDDYASGDTVVAEQVWEKVNEQDMPTDCSGVNQNERDDDEFSDCSIFYDEDIFKEADTIATALDVNKNQPTLQPPPRDRRSTNGLVRIESFRDETADLLEEFAHELIDPDSCPRDLARRNAR